MWLTCRFLEKHRQLLKTSWNYELNYSFSPKMKFLSMLVKKQLKQNVDTLPQNAILSEI